MPQKKKIRFLIDTAYNSIGDVVTVIVETENDLYYYDSAHRWCYIEKEFEGIDFEYVKTGCGKVQ